VLVCYDVTSRISFEHVKGWLQRLDDLSVFRFQNYHLVGTKVSN
jgi:GTPase SAR1 family protein